MGRLSVRELATTEGGAHMLRRWAILGATVLQFIIGVPVCARAQEMTADSNSSVTSADSTMHKETTVESTRLSDEIVEIPVDQIWGSGLRGNKTLRSLEPEYFIYRDTPEKIAKYGTTEGSKELHRLALKSLTYHIEIAMNSRKGKTEPGFVVVGRGREALQGVYDVLVKGVEPRSKLPSGAELSLIFFTYPAESYTGLKSVVREGKVIRIQYSLTANGQSYLSWQLAMIPLGKLSPGEYRVELVRASIVEPKSAAQRARVDAFPPVAPELEPLIVCQPFTFEVAELNEE